MPVNTSTQEAEAGRSSVPGWPGILSKTLSQKQKAKLENTNKQTKHG
jgi:hypothetical protein